MNTFLQELFAINQPLVFFVYGLVFFVLGLAITLQSRRHSRLILACRLHWLAFFGYLHGLHEWGDVFIPIQATYLPEVAVNFLEAVHLGLLALSFTCLFQFGVDLLRPMPVRWAWLRWLPVSALLFWALLTLVWLMATPVSLEGWHRGVSIWARYLLGLPGAGLAACVLYRYAPRLIFPLDDPQTLRTLRLAGLLLAGYALVAGLIVSPGPFFPASWLNSAVIGNWVGLPIPIFRSLLGLGLTLTIIRTLEIFDIEMDRRLSNMEEAEILAAERERIGRDLHDRTLQSIYATGLLLKATHELLDRHDDRGATGALGQATETLDQAVDQVRHHIAELRAQPTTISLAEGLTRLTHQGVLSSMAEVKLTLDLPEDRPIGAGQVGHLLAIAGEALSNVARHAQARHVQLVAQLDKDCLQLTIADDGRGIPSDYVAGYGLQNMHERARLLRGELSIHSQPREGTRLQLTVPLGDSQ
jgi:signal transduction histidine kinase